MDIETKIHLYPDKTVNSGFYQKLAMSPFLLSFCYICRICV